MPNLLAHESEKTCRNDARISATLTPVGVQGKRLGVAILIYPRIKIDTPLIIYTIYTPPRNIYPTPTDFIFRLPNDWTLDCILNRPGFCGHGNCSISGCNETSLLCVAYSLTHFFIQERKVNGCSALFPKKRPPLIYRLLGPGSDEELARDLDAVWPFEPAQLALDFRPSLFTLGFA
jgi:hypothetical protein